MNPLSPVDRLVAPAQTRMAGAMQAAEAVRQEAPRPQEDALSLSGVLFMEEPPPQEPPTAPAATRPAEAPPEVLLQETVQASAPEILESGVKLTYAQHLQLMADAASQGSATVAVVTAAGVPRQVQVHGASASEMAHVKTALEQLAAHDPHDLLVQHVKDVYVTDTLSDGGNGKATAGVALKQSDGETAVILSRMRGQASRNRLEKLSHVKNVLYHEIGHVLDNRYRLSVTRDAPYGEGDRARTGMTGDFVTDYAATSHREDYAETFAEFYTGRTSSDMTGCTDDDVIAVLSFGGAGRVGDKLKKLRADLGPELHCQDYTTQYLEPRRDEGFGPRQLVRRFYDDAEFRTQFAADLTAARPGVPRRAVYDYMAGLAELFDEPVNRM